VKKIVEVEKLKAYRVGSLQDYLVLDTLFHRGSQTPAAFGCFY
jgi:hypothetical protein